MSMTLTNPLNVFEPATAKPNGILRTIATLLAVIAVLAMPLVACFADDADAKARTAGAKTAFEIIDQAQLPDTSPNVQLNIRKPLAAAPLVSSPLDFGVLIKVSGDNACLGSGVITEAGVITCAHLFTIGDQSTEITVESASEVTSAMIAKIDYETDIAILSCDWIGKPSAKLAETQPAIGDPLVSIGRSRDGGVLSVDNHKVTGLAKYEDSSEILYLPPPWEGRSGGGVFNKDGEIVGIVQMFDDDGTGIAGSVIDIRGLLKRKIGRRVITTDATYCAPCKASHRRNGRGNDSVDLVYLKGDRDGWHRSKSISEAEFQMMLTEMRKGRTLPFAMWQSKSGKWYAHEASGWTISDFEKWIEESDKPRKATAK